MVRRKTKQRVLAGLLLAAGLACCWWHVGATPPVGAPPQAEPRPAASTIKITQNIPGDSKAIVLNADEIITWTEGTRRVLLLKGTVLIEHGVLHARMQQAAVWVDSAQTRKTGITHVDVYAEGEVAVENGTSMQRGPKAVLDLNTRGELKVKAPPGKIGEQARPQDPLYLRGLAEKGMPAGTAEIQRTSFQPDGTVPVTPVPGPGTLPPAGQPGLEAPARQPSGPLPGPAPLPPGARTPPPAGGAQPLPDLPRELPPGPTTPGPPIGIAPAVPPAGGALATAAAASPLRQIRVVPRTSAPFQVQEVPSAAEEKTYVITGGVIVTVASPSTALQLVDIEADRLVIWTRGDGQHIFSGMRSPQGETVKNEVEFYLAGNVVLREKLAKEQRTLTADEVYYDVSRNVAVAYQADLEISQPRLIYPLHVKADELLQVTPKHFKAIRSEVFASQLPSDPGLKVTVKESSYEEKQVPRRSFLGLGSRAADAQATEEERLFRGSSVFLELENVPIFYFPYVQGDPLHPLGPVEAINAGFSQMFGVQMGVVLDVYHLFGLDPVPGTRWRLSVDELTYRGPALGTVFDYSGMSMFDVPGPYQGSVRAWGILDDGFDLLGADRGAVGHPYGRGRVLFRHQHELPEDFTLQMQASVLSDKNFLEEFYYNEFNTDINQETFVYLKQQRDNWAWTGLFEPRIRNWVNEGQKLPQGDFYLLGQSFFNLLTYNLHGSAGYDQLLTSNVPPPPREPTTVADSTGRFDIWQDLSLPFSLGPVRVVPYGVIDLAYYTNDLTGDDRGRFYAAGGSRASLPLSRVYADVASDIFNLNGINHKIVFSGNYYVAHSDTPFTRLPQIDRLNDDASDQSVRDMVTLAPTSSNPNALFVATSPLFDAQTYAIRRLVDNRIDTLDSVEVLQADIRQRWQTKRGYPGMQHIVDWMLLDLSASYFPQPSRDNFGEPFAFLEYDYAWHVGDRTTLVSTGWFDPIDGGARVWNLGGYFNRTDRTAFTVIYRQTDPLQSQVLSGTVTYVLSPKYAVSAYTNYDFATHSGLTNGFVFTRVGSDLMLSVGLSYNSLLDNVGFTFEVLPNLVAQKGKHGAVSSGLISQR